MSGVAEAPLGVVLSRERPGGGRAGGIVAIAAALGLAVTILTLIPSREAYAYRSPAVHVAIETTTGLVALLAAYLVLGRYRRGARLDDLLTSLALGVSGTVQLAFAVPGSAAAPRHAAFVAWTPLMGHTISAALLAAAAFCPVVVVARPLRAARLAGIAAVSALAAVPGGVALLQGRLPAPPSANVAPPAPAGFFEVGPPSMLALLCVLGTLLAVAAIGYARRAPSVRDELTRWLAGGCALGAFARLNYVIFPSMHSTWIYSGDVLRLGFYLFVTIGAVREIGRYQRELAEAAVDAERRRLARDLHDDVAQDLAYIALELRLGRRRSDAWLEDVAAAAERALATSRSVITALRQREQPLEQAIAVAAEQISARTGVRVRADVAPGDEPDPWTVEALERVVREAALNAARHGAAGEVVVHVQRDDGIRMTVSDDGRGFDPDVVAHDGDGFGLVGMRERVERLGGVFRISSRPGRGAVVEVFLP